LLSLFAGKLKNEPFIDTAVQLWLHFVACYLTPSDLNNTKYVKYIILFSLSLPLYQGTESCTYFRPLHISASLSFRVGNPLKTKHISGLRAYRAANTLHFGYKNQSLNVL
jgi:hypothetical protein